jgi:superfamily II RNA helicase
LTFAGRLPATRDADSLLEAFLAGLDVQPYPSQTEALMGLALGANVILSTPTGSGKSLVAEGAHFFALASGLRTFYTAPIKALVSEKFFALAASFGPENVGMTTGDQAVNPTAPIVCCTAEILANLALRQGPGADIGVVVMDEFHFYSEPERGWAWQVPLLELDRAQFLLASATLGDVSFFQADLTRRTGRETTVVRSAERPVPLTYRYAVTPLQETVEELVSGGGTPAYLVHFSQAAAVERASALSSVKVASRAERDAIAAELAGFRFAAGFGKPLARMIRMGIGVHHAGMLPRYRRLVERLTQAGLLKIICGTDTLGVGIDVPIRTVVLTSLSKFDGNRTRLLSAREFHQIAGRAGRPGHDAVGSVVAQAPEHVIENEKARAKLSAAGETENRRRKLAKKRPPPGHIGWGEPTFDKLVAAEPEPLESSFTVTHAMLLNVIARPGDGFAAMRKLLTDNHEKRPAQRRHIRTAIAIYRSLRHAGVVERLDEADETGRRVVLTDELQLDFALNQPLSPFALAAIELLDADSGDYSAEVVSVIEATVEDPMPVLKAQRSAARGEAVAAMKTEGIPYEERMDLLEDVTYPRPLAELLEHAFETYRRGAPWVAELEISPKSVARDMHERAMNFVEYVGHYGLARSEGGVLRYLADVYKALRQTVPSQAKTEPLEDLICWLGELVRQVDQSLLAEWEQRLGPAEEPTTAREPAGQQAPPVTANSRAFRVLVRNRLFRMVELAARRDYRGLSELSGGDGWDAAAWAEKIEDYFDRHGGIGTGADAHGPGLLIIEERGECWRVRQIFDDPEGDHDWGIEAEVDLAASDRSGTAVLRLVDVGPPAPAWAPAPDRSAR